MCTARYQPMRIIWAIPSASLLTVLLLIALNAYDVLTPMTGQPRRGSSRLSQMRLRMPRCRSAQSDEASSPLPIFL
jgi:hypothetical protein